MGNRVTVFILGPAVGPWRRTSDAFLRVCTPLCVRVRACVSPPHCPRFLCVPRSPLALVPRLWPPVGENRGVCEAGRRRPGPAPKRARGCAGQGSRGPGGGSSVDPRARPPEPTALGPEGPAGWCRRRNRRGGGTRTRSVCVLDGPAPAPQDGEPQGAGSGLQEGRPTWICPVGPARAPREQNGLAEVERREPREQTRARDSSPAPASREPWGRGCGAPGGSASAFTVLQIFLRAAENE
ncbi:PREDICTED: zinc finger protein 12 isoform X3 [Cercocebus atys]|uniref:zinc finger protein 12 isoform X3 n=1 Tax=Cercocebus atys TaxID=9531 RepID=UPI0005F58D99|nr:PREDICTED: zinc finger protein 12 isoform X3 [Cercocebus atys]